jgi:hypothetical protein
MPGNGELALAFAWGAAPGQGLRVIVMGVAIGVVCDGVVDDSAAINAALASFRAQFKSPYAVRGRIIFPASDCRVTHSINLTGLKSKSVRPWKAPVHASSVQLMARLS